MTRFKVVADLASVQARQVLWALLEKQAQDDMELVLVNTQKQRQQSALIPSRVPLLNSSLAFLDNHVPEMVLSEPSAICRYLDEVLPCGTDLVPYEPFNRVLMEQWVSFALTSAPEYGFYRNAWSRQSYTEEWNQNSQQHCKTRAFLTALDSAIRKQGSDYLAGREFSLADIFLVQWVIDLQAHTSLIDNSLPYLWSWFNRVISREAWKQLNRITSLP
jgi:glutathione S-transferase